MENLHASHDKNQTETPNLLENSIESPKIQQIALEPDGKSEDPLTKSEENQDLL